MSVESSAVSPQKRFYEHKARCEPGTRSPLSLQTLARKVDVFSFCLNSQQPPFGNLETSWSIWARISRRPVIPESSTAILERLEYKEAR